MFSVDHPNSFPVRLWGLEPRVLTGLSKRRRDVTGDGTLMSDGGVQSVITTGWATGRHTNVWKGDGALWRVIRTTGQPDLHCCVVDLRQRGQATGQQAAMITAVGVTFSQWLSAQSGSDISRLDDRTTVSFNYRTYCCLLLPHITFCN